MVVIQLLDTIVGGVSVRFVMRLTIPKGPTEIKQKTATEAFKLCLCMNHADILRLVS